MILRSWQQKIIDEYPSIIKQNKRFILKAPTGAGKTILASEIVERFYKEKKILVLCHRLVLLEQLERALSKRHKVRKLSLSDSGPAFNDYDILLSTNMRAKDVLEEAIRLADLIIVDEAHRVSPNGSGYKKILDDFDGKVINGNGVKRIIRKNESVIVTLEDKKDIEFDKVVCASHADQTFEMIKDLSKEEKEVLKPWTYSKNTTVLHTDISFMPPTKSAWACWNYVKNKNSNDGDDVSVTYYMNRLQGLKTKKNYLVTLNPTKEIPDEKKIYETTYTHPKYTRSSISTQDKIKQINGSNHLYFCGSYCRYGFHEDGVISAVNVAKKLDCEL